METSLNNYYIDYIFKFQNKWRILLVRKPISVKMQPLLELTYIISTNSQN